MGVGVGLGVGKCGNPEGEISPLGIPGAKSLPSTGNANCAVTVWAGQLTLIVEACFREVGWTRDCLGSDLIFGNASCLPRTAF